jgi:hypothetical protein
VTGRGRTLVTVGLLLLAGTTALAGADVGPFWVWYYHCAWAGTLATLYGGLAWRTGEWPLSGPALLSLFFWSAPFWYVFELANFRLENWFYVSVPPDAAVRWAGTFLAFSTVLPALSFAHRWTTEVGLAEGIRGPAFRVRSGTLGWIFGAGVAFVVLALVRPTWFYPLIWGAVTLLLEPWNYRRDPGGSLLADLARGRWARLLRLLAAGLAIGILWEGYNFLAAGRWIYTVPGLEGMKIFEMPVPGFLGFPVLALDSFVAYRALVAARVALPAWRHDDPEDLQGEGVRGRTAPASVDASAEGAGGGVRPARAVPAAAAAVLFAGAVQAGVDRWTVESVHPALGELPAVERDAAAALRDAGVDRPGELARADSAALARRAGLPVDRVGAAVRAARLAELRGMGAENASALWAGGVRTVCDLAAVGWRSASEIVGAARPSPRAGKPARVRVWIRAARERCPATEPG